MWILLFATFGALLVSLVSKFLAEVLLIERFPVLGEFIGLSLVRNAGVAFGIMFPSVVQGALIAGALLLVGILAYRSRQETLRSVSFGLIIGGALANIVDRLDDQLVTDFIQVGAFPTFNAADSCITVGVVILLGWEWWQARHPLDRK